MTELLILGYALALVFITAGSPTTDRSGCCLQKSVGGVTFTFVEKGNTDAYGCLSDCVYEKNGEMGSKFCFVEGKQEVQCLLYEISTETEETMDFGPAKNQCHAKTYNIDTWEMFKTVFNKTYGSSAEEEKRKEIFMLNKKNVEEHNKIDQSDIEKFAINIFSDLTYEEFVISHTGARGPENDEIIQNKFEPNSEGLPKSFDWTNFNAVTAVKYQENCGACGVFAATGALEGSHFLGTGHLTNLSEQQLLDCTYTDLDYDACIQGVGPLNAFSGVKIEGGMLTAKEYPYKGKQENCSRNKYETVERIARVSEYGKVNSNIHAIQEYLIMTGPLVAMLWASRALHLHDFNVTPIFKQSHSSCIENANDQYNHAVLLVGYGENEDGVPYWRLKNSWGTKFGECGYFKVLRGENVCNIETYIRYVTTKEQEECNVYHGHFIAKGNTVAKGSKTNIEDCRNWCIETATCRFWSYNFDVNFCWLKFSKEQMSCPDEGCDNDEWITATRSCSDTKIQAAANEGRHAKNQLL